MTIHIYERKNYEGASRQLHASTPNLGRDVNRPSSIWLDDPSDAVLLYKRDGWLGGVHYLRGYSEVPDLGSPAKGGRRTFGNSVASIRLSPFRLDLNITVIERRNGDLPGTWRNELRAERDIEDIVRLANNFLEDQKALISLRLARLRHRPSDALYVMPSRPSVPSHWRQSGDVDVLIAHRLASGEIGRAPYPSRGNLLRMAAGTQENGAFKSQTLVEMAGTLMHEIGHYLGLRHADNELNLMFPTSERTLLVQHLTTDQIRCMHSSLSQNLSRRRVRND